MIASFRWQDSQLTFALLLCCSVMNFLKLINTWKFVAVAACHGGSAVVIPQRPLHVHTVSVHSS